MIGLFPRIEWICGGIAKSVFCLATLLPLHQASEGKLSGSCNNLPAQPDKIPKMTSLDDLASLRVGAEPGRSDSKGFASVPYAA